jgi:hypothetical protein
MINYSEILSLNYATNIWSLIGNSYDGLDWQDESPKPTQAELDALAPSTEDTIAKDACKSQATQILNSTDWTSIADVGDPSKSNPYLVNQADFISYRSTVRNLAVNPVENPTFPTAPTEQWSS